MGYVKQDISSAVTMNNGNNSRIEIVKESDGTSWGALYAQFFQSSQKVRPLSSGLTVEREILDSKGNVIAASSGKATVGVGSKVKVRITITADRDYDFVEVIDKRAACLEPVSQLSSYKLELLHHAT